MQNIPIVLIGSSLAKVKKSSVFENWYWIKRTSNSWIYFQDVLDFEFLGFLGGGKHELSSTNPPFFIKTPFIYKKMCRQVLKFKKQKQLPTKICSHVILFLKLWFLLAFKKNSTFDQSSLVKRKMRYRNQIEDQIEIL
jgi:hypothetical protein